MSNMHGYSDYNGPVSFSVDRDATSKIGEDEDDEDMNPLQAGYWMPGDSLAPPCGTSVPVIHQILRIASVTADDVLYDFGCGDGRICMEAWHAYQCRSVGIELEEDLVIRARALIAATCAQRESASAVSKVNSPEIYCMDLRKALSVLLHQPASEFTNSSEPTPVLPNPTIVILYLLPEALSEIEPLLSRLLVLFPDCRVLCNTWGIPGWKPVKESLIYDKSGSSGVSTKVFVYTMKSISMTHEQGFK